MFSSLICGRQRDRSQLIVTLAGGTVDGDFDVTSGRNRDDLEVDAETRLEDECCVSSFTLNRFTGR